MLGSTFSPIHISEFDASKVMLNMQSVSGTLLASTSNQTFELHLTDDHLITGGDLNYIDGNNDDSVQFQIIDIDNIFGFGANFILRQFMNRKLPENFVKDYAHPIPAKIPGGLYIRCNFSNGANTPYFVAGFTLWKVLV
jgi:hypothetical protein